MKISKSQADELNLLCADNARRLHSGFEALRALDAGTIRVAAIRHAFESNLEQSDADLLYKHLIGLSFLRRRDGISAEQLIKNITENLQEFPNWEDEYEQNWNVGKVKLKELLDSSALTVSSKGLELSFDHEHILNSANILVDIRPIFDEERKKIFGAVVNLVLRIGYVSQGETQDIAIAMDLHDVERLRDECEAALEKAQISKSLMIDKTEIEAFVAGEEAQ